MGVNSTYHFVYKITNLIDAKFYIGVHSTNDIDDGYLGSGKLIRAAVKKHGAENFQREILYSLDTREDALKKEAEVANLETINNNQCYNLIVGGQGGPIYSHKAKTVNSRFDPVYRYNFVPNPPAVEKWREATIAWLDTIKSHKVYEFYKMINLDCFDLWETTLTTVSGLYNDRVKNKQAQELLSIFRRKNILDCIIMERRRWEVTG